MKKKMLLLILLVILVFIFSACKINDFWNNEKIPKTNNSQSQPNKDKVSQIDVIRDKISKMTLDEKIGQLVIVGIDGYTNDEHSTQMIEKYHVGGFILFKKNIKDGGQASDLLNSLKETNSKNKVPLFFGVDEEGGRVSRVPDEFVKIPSSKTIGRVNESNFSFEIGKSLAREIKSLGFNMDFAPVLDVNSNPNNPVIGDRAFGNNVDVVGKLGIQTMKGINSQNIISVVKHFPGHGDTSVDSHIGLPILYKDIDALKKLELIPFSQAVKNNVDAVMVAHILFPKIDTENPASFSKAIITDILRNDMKFNGVVITDDMTMGAITKNYDIGNSAIKSINAGSDIILVCHEYEKETAVLSALKNAVENGAISEKRIDESVYRILKLKQKYNISDKKTEPSDIKSINSEINDILNIYLKRAS